MPLVFVPTTSNLAADSDRTFTMTKHSIDAWEKGADKDKIFFKECAECKKRGYVCFFSKGSKLAPCAFCKFHKKGCDASPVDEESEESDSMKLPPPLSEAMTPAKYKGGLKSAIF